MCRTSEVLRGMCPRLYFNHRNPSPGRPPCFARSPARCLTQSPLWLRSRRRCRMLFPARGVCSHLCRWIVVFAKPRTRIAALLYVAARERVPGLRAIDWLWRSIAGGQAPENRSTVSAATLSAPVSSRLRVPRRLYGRLAGTDNDTGSGARPYQLAPTD